MINWEAEIKRYTLEYIKDITNKNLPKGTGNPAEHSLIAYVGKEPKV